MELNDQNKNEIFKILKERFEKNMSRHEGIYWSDVELKLKVNSSKIRTLLQMELSGGEPDVVDFNEETKEYIFIDCSKESPSKRRSFCYDREALNDRKPINLSTVQLISQKKLALLCFRKNNTGNTISWLNLILKLQAGFKLRMISDV